MHTALLATTKRRRSRITARQAAALRHGCDRLVRLDEADIGAGLAALAPLLDRLDAHSDWVLDIGFGTGAPVEQSARAEPDRSIIAVDLHTPGIGDLVHRITEHNLTNIVVVEADVRHVLAAISDNRLLGVRTFFPDPWPKKRHHRRRLVTDDLARQLAQRVRIGGFWHLATDWPDYAEHIEEVVSSSDHWRGGVIDRPDDRPFTRYESNAIAAGRIAIDLWFERIR